MCNMANRNKELVILVLEGVRIKVNKLLLIRKSHYFRVLLSESFNDYLKPEQVINYSVSEATLRNYVEWIQDDRYEILRSEQKVKYCLREFRDQGFINVLKLLELSVLFVTDQLTEELIEFIELYYLFYPHYLIDIWLMAQKLALHTLRDISLAACLDQFDKLSVTKILSLKGNDFMKLIGNNNLRSTSNFLLYITQEWLVKNDNSFSQKVISKVMQHRKATLLHCIIPSDENDYDVREIKLYCSNSNVFFLYSVINFPKEVMGKPELIGMQYTGRGYNIYLCGGQYGTTSRFNKIVWRYSLLSKRWFYETTMPIPRKNMVVATLKDQLIFIGGKRENNILVSRVDIYDISKRLWSRSSDIFFNYIPEWNICNGNLILHSNIPGLMYLFRPDKNLWLAVDALSLFTQEVRSTRPTYEIGCVPIVGHDDDTCYIDLERKYMPYVSIRNVLSKRNNCIWRDKCEDYKLQSHESHSCHFTHTIYKQIYQAQCENNSNLYVISTADPRDSPEIHVHTWDIKNDKKFKLDPNRLNVRIFFRILDPTDLHNTLNLYEP